ncbi:hypothetical protein HY213_00005 [Candidatus Peregrinibacteria bacterium]|nr:hypothetical protein [Candidatus Peregrinibacteria bacterium]
MRMKKLVSILYTASILLGSFCPMPMASAMPLPKAMERVSQVQAVMSPNILYSAPMTPAPVMASYFESSPIAMAPGGCPGGNCVVMDHSLKQEIAMSAAAGDVRGGTTLPVIVPSIADSLSSPSLPFPHLGGSYLVNTIATIVVRV